MGSRSDAAERSKSRVDLEYLDFFSLLNAAANHIGFQQACDRSLRGFRPDCMKVDEAK